MTDRWMTSRSKGPKESREAKISLSRGVCRSSGRCDLMGDRGTGYPAVSAKDEGPRASKQTVYRSVLSLFRPDPQWSWFRCVWLVEQARPPWLLLELPNLLQMNENRNSAADAARAKTV